MKAFNLKTEQLCNPMLIDVNHPTLSWQCPMGVMQSAYQVQVFCENNLIWDSGKTEGSEQQLMYPHQLPSKADLNWQVQIWTAAADHQGGEQQTVECEWSEPAYFSTGLSPKQWSAKWISPEETIDSETRQPAGYLRKRFYVTDYDATNSKAKIYCTAHGLYTVYLNGKRIGEDVLTPGSDEYKQRLTYQKYEITNLLTEGENELLVVLGDGWYRGCNGIDGVRNLFGDDLSFLAQVELDEEVILQTDETWEASQSGPIRMTDMELGEVYDAQMEAVTEWHPATVMEAFGYENLVASNCMPIREKECFTGKLIQTPNGEYVYDFGQNLAGYTAFTVEAKAGQIIKLVHGEELDENGNFTIANFQPGERNQSGGIKQEILYTCKDGKNNYKPSFSIFGFRYAKVESEIPAEQIQVVAHAVYSDMEETAAFTCDNESVNQLFVNSIWSMKSNFCDLPTDCPTRERAGWTGDAGVFAPTGSVLMNCYPVFRKWLANVRYNQHEDGKMAYISPTNGKGGQISEMFSTSVGWGDASVLVPYALYRTYGDKKILTENYDMMKKWVNFLSERAKQSRENDPYEGNPYQNYIINTGMDYGEWCEPGANVMQTMQNAFANGQPEVATAYFANSARLLSEIAAELGQDDDQKYYNELALYAKKAYQSICVEDGRIHSERQCEYVRPLAFGLLSEEGAKTAAADLNELVIKNDYHLNTGFLSTPYLCEVLVTYGYVDTAYKLLLQKDCPGWLYAVEMGATTIWETWDGIREDRTVRESLNHYSYGAISGWLISGVCGIRYTQDSLTIAPTPNTQLGRAKAVFESPKGRIVSAWEYDGEGKIRYHIEIPGNTEADVVLADGTREHVTSGVYTF